MPRREAFKMGEIYHITNHAIDDKLLYCEDCDYSRFIESMEVFNQEKKQKIRDAREQHTFPVGGYPPTGKVCTVRDTDGTPLVEIFSFTLIPNHYHLLLRQLVDNGIRRFMTKLNVGFANYYNKKYYRKGPLFQHRYQVTHIKDESHYNHITRYIHLNILDLTMPEWREGDVLDWDKASEELYEYPWSSCNNYLLNKDSNLITKIDNYEDLGNYEEYLREWAQRNLPTPPRGGKSVASF